MNNQFAGQIAGRNAKIQIHPVIQNLVIKGQIQLVEIEVRLNLNAARNTDESGGTEAATTTLLDYGVVKANIGQ